MDHNISRVNKFNVNRMILTRLVKGAVEISGAEGEKIIQLKEHVDKNLVEQFVRMAVESSDDSFCWIGSAVCALINEFGLDFFKLAEHALKKSKKPIEQSLHFSAHINAPERTYDYLSSVEVSSYYNFYRLLYLINIETPESKKQQIIENGTIQQLFALALNAKKLTFKETEAVIQKITQQSNQETGNIIDFLGPNIFAVAELTETEMLHILKLFPPGTLSLHNKMIIDILTKNEGVLEELVNRSAAPFIDAPTLSEVSSINKMRSRKEIFNIIIEDYETNHTTQGMYWTLHLIKSVYPESQERIVKIYEREGFKIKYISSKLDIISSGSHDKIIITSNSVHLNDSEITKLFNDNLINLAIGETAISLDYDTYSAENNKKLYDLLTTDTFFSSQNVSKAITSETYTYKQKTKIVDKQLSSIDRFELEELVKSQHGQEIIVYILENYTSFKEEHEMDITVILLIGHLYKHKKPVPENIKKALHKLEPKAQTSRLQKTILKSNFITTLFETNTEQN